MKLGNKIENHSCNMWIMFYKFYKAYIYKVMDGLMGKVDELSVNVVYQFDQQLWLYIRMDGLVRLTDKVMDVFFGWQE